MTFQSSPVFTLFPNLLAKQISTIAELYSFVMVLSLRLRIYTLAPSKLMARGALPVVNVPRFAPSLASSLVTLLEPKFATQMLRPSKVIPTGELPTLKVPITAPSGANSSPVSIVHGPNYFSRVRRNAYHGASTSSVHG